VHWKGTWTIFSRTDSRSPGCRIEDLLAFLRVGGHVVDISRAIISGSNTVARHASVIRDFLKWAVDLTSQGRSQMAAFQG
jgi:hypothetical protein